MLNVIVKDLSTLLNLILVERVTVFFLQQIQLMYFF